MQRFALNRTGAVLAMVLCVLAFSGCGGAQARKAKHLEKGQDYLAAGNYEKARVEFQNALQIAPMDADARFENGVVAEKLGKPRDAAQFYQRAIDVSPDMLGARSKLARLFLFSGAPDRAIELLEPALQKHPDDSELLALRAASRVQLKDMSGAQADAERAVQLAPTNEDAVSTLAGIFTATKNSDKARVLLEQSISAIPATVDLRLALAQVYAGENRVADTERELQEVVRLKPNEKANRMRLAQFYSRQKQLDAAESTLRDGLQAIPHDRELQLFFVEFLASQRSPEAAEKELQSLITAEPKDVELKFALAKFYEGTRQPERAEKIYHGVIDTEKLNAAGLSARDRLALLYAQRNDMAGTEHLIAEVLAKSPRDTDALVLRGNIELSRKDPKAAIADLRTVLRDQPNAVGVLRTLARAHLANKEPAIAEETMRRAVEANPGDASLRLDLAQLLAQLGKPDQAKPIVAALVKEQPGNMAALDVLFRLSAETKDYDGAKTAAQAMVATQPKVAAGYLYEGMLAEEVKHNDEALRLYSQAVDLQPDALEPLQSEIRLLVLAKRIPEALKRLDEVAARAPTTALALNLKGELLAGQGNLSDAQTAYKTAIERAPTWWMPYRGLAQAQAAYSEPDAALATLREGQKKSNQPDQLGLEIAAFFERSGKPDEAMHEYEDVLRRNPDSEVAANNLAMMLVTFKKDSASLDRAKTLTTRFANSSNASYLDTYGWVLFKHGEAAASIAALQNAAAKVPDAPAVLYHLGMAQSQSGSTALAVGNLSRAVKSGSKFSGLDEAKATLDKLSRLSADSGRTT